MTINQTILSPEHLSFRIPDTPNYLDHLSPEAEAIILTLPLRVQSTLERFGDTWILKSNLTYSSNEFFFLIPFYSNGFQYSQFSHFFDGENHRLFYNTTLANCCGENWVKDEYRIISFTSKLDNNLLHWLESNAVRL